MQSIKLSIVMIVRNEEVVLSRCLDSVKEADEIIIVDTGSVDKTKEVAQRFTDKIYDFKWCDDFAKARNFALSKATGEWVLSIDADEYLEEGGVQKIKDYLTFCRGNILNIKMLSNIIPFYAPRLFRNMADIFWVGAVHELPNITTEDRIEVGITYTSSPAHAYDPDRNLRIHEKVLLEDPNNTRNIFYLARDYGYRKDYEKAKELFNLYLSKATWFPEKADAYFMLALCYWYDGKSNGELARQNCLMAININANFKAAILLMGHMSFPKNKVQWEKMAETATNEDTLFNRIDYLNI